MRITLTRTGGIIPVTKKAEKDVTWSEDELKKLIERIKQEDDTPDLMRDHTSFEISYAAGSFPINIDKVPAKYKKTFEDLKDNLKIIKGDI